MKNRWLLNFSILLFGLLLHHVQIAHAHGDLIDFSHAPVSRTDCSTLLHEILKEIEDPKLAQETYDFTMKTPTIRSLKHEPGIHGGNRITIERTGKSWASDHRTVKFDPQGDPRWFIEVAGPETAQYFGFKIIDDTHMTVPDFKEFDGALQKINAQLVKNGEKPLAIKFYPTVGTENVSVSTYVHQFVTDQSIPFAPHGNHLLHDLSYHTGGIFLPKELVEFKLERIHYENAFFDALKKKYAHNEEALKSIHYFEYQNNFKNTVDIDSGTGAVNSVVSAYNRNRETLQNEHNLLGSLASYFTGGRSSPQEQLQGFFKKAEQRAALGIWSSKPEKVQRSFLALPEETYQKELKLFTDHYRSKNPSFSPAKPFLDFENTKKLTCETVTGKRLLVQKIVRQLAK